MEGFSDGVFGFAITLLVVDIALHPPGTPCSRCFTPGPPTSPTSPASLTIGGAWLLHTALTEQLAGIDQLFLRLNLLVLFVVVFLPFPTRLVAGSLASTGSERVYVTMYGLSSWLSACWVPSWTRTRGTSTCTRRRQRGRSCRAPSGNSCPSSSGT
jgi:uncharacterized membrane protein